MTAHPDKQVNGELTAAILKAVNAGPLSRADIAAKVKKPDWAVSDALAQLAAKGLVHRQGGGPRNYKWHLGAKGASRSPAKEAVR